MDTTAQESWRTLNNYMGTYTDPPATTFASGAFRVDPGPTTWWRSEEYMATFSALATIDSGMAQISWKKNNLFSGDTSVGTASSSASNGTADVKAQMFTYAGSSAPSASSSVQSSTSAISASSSSTQSGSLTAVGAGNVAAESTSNGPSAGPSSCKYNQTYPEDDADLSASASITANAASSFGMDRANIVCLPSTRARCS
jgi:hypothetical protein